MKQHVVHLAWQIRGTKLRMICQFHRNLDSDSYDITCDLSRRFKITVTRCPCDPPGYNYVYLTICYLNTTYRLYNGYQCGNAIQVDYMSYTNRNMYVYWHSDKSLRSMLIYTHSAMPSDRLSQSYTKLIRCTDCDATPNCASFIESVLNDTVRRFIDFIRILRINHKRLSVSV